ncbi:hypothetical protein FRB96_004746 [Tulasnella sp. 330]|nr:hypothetical protein FRB96_004746 [Tulasnella sp. 330]KAG8876784.1 hypothetical protein FRB97_003935 [Tulasnella sp. 331]KAG8882046.1 hypothetical protein FRB98_003964 [Tulasnella sp. 332]
MILAKEFSRSAVARQSDFTTSTNERGVFVMQERSSNRKRLVRGSLIAQFAASEATSFADAAELIWPHIDGIDLNCGCPQPWAYKERIGSFLLRQPDTIRDIIHTTRGRVGQRFPISIKIRIDSDLKKTDQLIQTAIHAGASHIAVHGRTRHQPSTAPVSLESISFAVEAAKGVVPIVANGDAWSFVDSENIRETTGVQGVMSARGLLANPEFVWLSTSYGLPFGLFHRHLQYMLEDRLMKQERAVFTQLPSLASTIDYLESLGMDFGEES